MALDCPDWLSEEARRAAVKMRAYLEARGDWDELYLAVLFGAASVTAHYVTFARAASAHGKWLPGEWEELEMMRQDARRLLEEMHYPLRVRHLSLFVDGVDAELAALCS